MGKRAHRCPGQPGAWRHRFTAPALLCPKPHRGSFINPSPQATENPLLPVSICDGLPHGSKLDCSRQKTYFFFIITLSLVAGQYKYWPRSGLIILLAGSHQRYQPRGRRGPAGVRAAKEELEDHWGHSYHHWCQRKSKSAGVRTAVPLIQPVSSLLPRSNRG